ncbi:MaoC family dehydratase [Lewinella sp. JB7]|uniref:MaoC family dehydratase n=1 Tax=Lewinella sp. JB7 TaxID=2962887 RepID=UPI0020C9EA55|nr:MaoC family dehydratase [Lewinella sp. JB7]MCP9236782.1 MaoC family dehydratase [Lewinella sp. JB7]
MDVTLGKEVTFDCTFSEEEVTLFAQISGDNNPIHLDKKYAEDSIFKRRIVHGCLVASSFSKIFGTLYPGEGSIYLSQTLKFIKPVYLGQLITAKATLIDFDPEKRRGRFTTECVNEESAAVLIGEAVVIFPDEK